MIIVETTQEEGEATLYSKLRKKRINHAVSPQLTILERVGTTAEFNLSLLMFAKKRST